MIRKALKQSIVVCVLIESSSVVVVEVMLLVERFVFGEEMLRCENLAYFSDAGFTTVEMEIHRILPTLLTLPVPLSSVEGELVTFICTAIAPSLTIHRGFGA